MSKIDLEKQAEGEAHLFVAIAKADGKVSREERAFAPYYAEKGQRLFNILGINDVIKKLISPFIKNIIDSSQYDSWDENRHLEKAMELLKSSNSPGLELIDPKNEEAFLSVAKLDGYLLKESQFLEKLKLELSKLK